MKKIFLLCAAVLLCACAKQPPVELGTETQTQLESRWLKFTALSAAPATPYRLQLSLRFGAKGDTRRVTALFWGNSERQLRLDVMAGVGAVVAKILEDGQHFLVYSRGKTKVISTRERPSRFCRSAFPCPSTSGIWQICSMAAMPLYSERVSQRLPV